MQYGSDPLDRSIRVEVITYVPTQFNPWKHCEVTWKVMGLRRKVQQEMLDSALPDDLAQEFHRLSEWARSLPEKFGERVRLRVVDAASIEGFFKTLWRWFHRHPAFTVGGQRYVGADFAHVEGLIVAELASPERSAGHTGPNRPEKGG